MPSRATVPILMLAVAACSAGSPDAAGNAALAERQEAAPEFSRGGSTFGAPASELSEAIEYPRLEAQFEPTDDELAVLGAELAREYSLEDFDVRKIAGAEVPPPSFRAAAVDLDGDGNDELLTLLAGFGKCGSGGCTFRVYSTKGGRLRKVSGTTITRLPIALTDHSTQGWRDITVSVCGGGLDPCGRSKLKFDGSRYPLNPTAPPALRTDEIGTVVLTEDSPIHPVPRPSPAS